MSDYSKTTNFTAKDALSTGDPDKLIKGSLFDTEFDNIATAVATKYDVNDIASTGQAEAETANTVLMTPLRVAEWSDANGGVVGELHALTDPGADRIFFWDDGEAADSNVAFLTVGDGIEISTTTLQLPSTLAGSGLTLTSGVLDVVGGSGITANANDIALTDAAATTTNPVDVSSGTISLDITALSQMDATDLDNGTQEFVVDDGGTSKALRWQDFGIPQTDDATTTPMSAADLTYANRWYNCDNASAISFVIPANASVAYPVGTVFAIHQRGAGQVTVSVTTDTLRAPNGAKTSQQYSTMFVTKIASTEWTITGDVTT